MYHNLEVPQKCEELWQECHTIATRLLQDYTPKAQGILVNSDNPILPRTRSVYLITQGEIFETYDGQLIVIHEKGDLVNADALAHTKLTGYETDFPAIVDEYDGDQLLEMIATDKNKFNLWNQYLSGLSQSYQLLMCHFSRQDTDFIPEFRQYKKDDVIIEENTEGDEVFTLLSGTTKVMSNNEEVGEIKEDEIFGAIAALTHTKRTASVIATSDCDTLVAKSENFRSIVATRPDITQKLLQDMARTIVSSNARIIELSKEKEAES